MTRNEMCRVWLNISHYFWRSKEQIERAKKYRVFMNEWNSASLKSYTAALIKHDRMFDTLSEKVK